MGRTALEWQWYEWLGASWRHYALWIANNAVLCCAPCGCLLPRNIIMSGSCLKTGQHFIFVIIYLLLPIKCIIFHSVSKILFIFLLSIIIIMILIMKILLHNVHKIIILRYPTYVYQFLIFLIITKRVLACFQTRPLCPYSSPGALAPFRMRDHLSQLSVLLLS